MKGDDFFMGENLDGLKIFKFMMNVISTIFFRSLESLYFQGVLTYRKSSLFSSYYSKLPDSKSGISNYITPINQIVYHYSTKTQKNVKNKIRGNSIFYELKQES